MSHGHNILPPRSSLLEIPWGILFAITLLVLSLSSCQRPINGIQGGWLGRGEQRTGRTVREVTAQLDILSDGTYHLFILEPEFFAAQGVETGEWFLDDEVGQLTLFDTSIEGPFSDLRILPPDLRAKTLTVEDGKLHLKHGSMSIQFSLNSKATKANIRNGNIE